MCFVQSYSKYHAAEYRDKKFKKSRNPAAVLAISWRWTEATFLLIWTGITFTNSVFWWHHGCFSWCHIHSTIYVLSWWHRHTIISLVDKINLKLKYKIRSTNVSINIPCQNSRPRFWIGWDKDSISWYRNRVTDVSKCYAMFFKVKLLFISP